MTKTKLGVVDVFFFSFFFSFFDRCIYRSFAIFLVGSILISLSNAKSSSEAFLAENGKRFFFFGKVSRSHLNVSPLDFVFYSLAIENSC